MKFLTAPSVQLQCVLIGRNDIPLSVQGAVTKCVTDRRAGIQYWVDGVNESVGDSLVRLGEKDGLPTIDSLRFTLKAIAAHLLEHEL